MRTWIKLILLVFLIIQFKAAFSQEFEMPGYISDLNACDFDNNGAYDILVSCPYSDTSVILFNNGFGGFEINYYEITSLHAICGCVDEDSLPDLIAGVGQQYFHKSNGDRTFEDGIHILTFSGTITVYGLVDLNDDEWNDLLYTNTSDEYWGIFKNNGDLTFTNEIIQSGSSTTTPAVGFITDDSLPDIVLTYSAFDRSSVNINNGNLSFTEIVLEESFLGEAFGMNIDNDGTNDFAFANYYTKTVPLYKFIGNNQFELQSNFYAEGTYPLSSFLPADFNQDGFDDFAITRGDWWNGSDSLYIYFNNHNWSFYLNQILYIGELNWYKSRTADLNGDSFPDILIKGYNGSNILTLLWNDGNGNFSNENPVGISEPGGFASYSISASPNPFTDKVTFTINAEENTALQVMVYNVFGRKIKGFQPEGWKPCFTWNGHDDSGLACPPGLYLIMVEVGKYRNIMKVVKL